MVQRVLIFKGLNDTVGLARDYTNIGNVLNKAGRLEEALEWHNKALEIHKGLNDFSNFKIFSILLFSLSENANECNHQR